MQKDIFAPEKYLHGNQLELVAGGEAFFTRLIHIIDEAQRHIHFQVYLFDEDRTGKEVAEALKKARQRGVDIFLAVDSYGSKSLSPEFVDDLQNSGIHFNFFSPLPKHFYSFRLGRRLHSKVIVADHIEALVGGINIADKYRGSPGEAPWLDFAIHIKGPASTDLSRICGRIYGGKYFGKLHAQGTMEAQYPFLGATRSRIALNDWFRRKNQIAAPVQQH